MKTTIKAHQQRRAQPGINEADILGKRTAGTLLKGMIAGLVLAAPGIGLAQDITNTVDFEGFAQQETLGVVALTDVSFWFGTSWLALDTTQESSVSGNSSGVKVAISTSASDSVHFSACVGKVEFAYSSPADLNIVAYDANGVSLGSVAAPALPNHWHVWSTVSFTTANLRNTIASVVITGSYSTTMIDDFSVTILENTVQTVAIDVQENQGNAVDLINIQSNGSLWVAVLSSAEFDATSVDVTTVTLGDPLLVNVAGVVAATPTHVKTSDVNDDGIPDLELKFHTGDLVDGGAITLETTYLILEGTTHDGQDFEGFDDVIVRTNSGGNVVVNDN